MITVDGAERRRHDAPLTEAVLAEAAEALGGFDDVLANKGFDSDAIGMAVLADHDALPVIPNKANRKDQWPWDGAMSEWYKKQNRIDRAFAKAKQYGRFATRFEKLNEMYLGVVRMVFGLIHVMKLARNVSTP